MYGELEDWEFISQVLACQTVCCGRIENLYIRQLHVKLFVCKSYELLFYSFSVQFCWLIVFSDCILLSITILALSLMHVAICCNIWGSSWCSCKLTRTVTRPCIWAVRRGCLAADSSAEARASKQAGSPSASVQAVPSGFIWMLAICCRKWRSTDMHCKLLYIYKRVDFNIFCLLVWFSAVSVDHHCLTESIEEVGWISLCIVMIWDWISK